MERLRDTEFIDRREIISEIFKEKPKELDNYFVAGIIRCIFIIFQNFICSICFIS